MSQHDNESWLSSFDAFTNTAARLLGPPFVVIAIVLILLIAAIYLIAVLPYNYALTELSFWTCIGLLLDFCTGIYVLTLILFNYFWAIRKDPGSPSLTSSAEPSSPQHIVHFSHSPDGSTQRDDEVPMQSQDTKDQTSRIAGTLEPGSDGRQTLEKFINDLHQVKTCRKCHRVKPPRTHHDSVTKTCVLKMDHFCPWIAGCVGHYNHRYFFLFMVFLDLGCLYICVQGRSLFTLSVRRTYYGRLDLDWVSVVQPVWIIFSYAICFAMLIAVGLMTFWHFYLISTSQTTIEYYVNGAIASSMMDEHLKYRNKFDLGKKQNLKHFFNIGERYRWYTIFLPVTIPPPTDGTWFPTREKCFEDSRTLLPL